MTTNLRHHRIMGNGVVQHYVTAGEGQSLILLHGFPQTWLMWRPIIDRLAAHFRLIVPDLRGLGGVPGPSDGYDKHTLAADVKAIVQAECGNEPVVLCGHDMGAYVAFAYALNYRSGVKGLITVDAPLPGTTFGEQIMSNPRTWHINFHANADIAHMLIAGREREYIRYFIMSRIYNAGAVTEQEVDLYAAAYSAPGALRAALEMYRSLAKDRELNLSSLQKDGKLEMPYVAVGCSMTAVEEVLQGMVDEVSVNGSIRIVEPSGHWIPEEHPDRLSEIIIETANRGRQG
ncbi:alpha/beta fold hydrolase [Paenibacillus sp. VMFN-D1]|uniref:alpha/beta fold hydrolase n=1 Tax=Paenibacillus sp. VMFN-D1 TaxID=2135608 RepID=UPI000E390CCF|nr:alpha/beta hydrolase [Paenibacillus sp. VMFN-D1]RED37390.1 pimeloyl-ACP methyl ester carboxylesterase [Paenibacillus sp. VMFN-D1]